ncbi:MAG: Mov34/MPN/PAD-1 family protein [Spirochaetia bacterium]|nr:Mov34/MPN/PAD-1 family protein [Spirochaetia bacterium]
MEVTIYKETMDQVFAHAIDEYPNECCGWIIQDQHSGMVYVRAENLQNKYHKLDPETYPRTSKDAFLMDSLKLSRAVEAAQNAGGSLYSLVHSHIDCGAYFSKEDEIQMTAPDFSEPVFPAGCYLVVSVEKGEPSESAVFIFDSIQKKYIKADLKII